MGALARMKGLDDVFAEHREALMDAFPDADLSARPIDGRKVHGGPKEWMDSNEHGAPAGISITSYRRMTIHAAKEAIH